MLQKRRCGACPDLRSGALFPETPAPWPCAVSAKRRGGLSSRRGHCRHRLHWRSAGQRLCQLVTPTRPSQPLPPPSPPPPCRLLARGRVQPAMGRRWPPPFGPQPKSFLEASPDPVLLPLCAPTAPGNILGQVPHPLSPRLPSLRGPCLDPTPVRLGPALGTDERTGLCGGGESTWPPTPPSHPTARSVPVTASGSGRRVLGAAAHTSRRGLRGAAAHWAVAAGAAHKPETRPGREPGLFPRCVDPPLIFMLRKGVLT